ncbi:IS30 family transposase, partial [Bacillus cereus]
SKGCLATFVERKTRYLVALPIPNRTAASMNQSIHTVCATLPEHTFHTATCDRGKEFAQHEQIEKEVGIDIYFADAYSSWQRGTNENTNGLLREFFPKGTDFLQISWEELSHAVDSINHRPRKCLDWLSAHEAFMAELLHFD